MQVFTRKILIAFFITFSFTNTFSQSKTTFCDNCLWIKGKEQTNSSTINIEVIEEIKNSQLNFNPTIDFKNDKILNKYKNLVTKKFTFFIVLKSLAKDEKLLLSFNRSSSKSSLSNTKMYTDKEVLFTNDNPKNGSIVSYLSSKNSIGSKKNGSLLFDDILFDNNKEHQILELLYLPRLVSEKEQSYIETYLSIKYGISLKDKNYYGSTEKKIWDYKENITFNNRVTGIGNDEKIGLNQKQSQNSLQDGLSIGLGTILKKNIDNKSILINNSYLLWGDNNKTTVLEKEKNKDQKRMKRVWKLVTVSDSVTDYTTQFKIDKKLMSLDLDKENKDPIWLVIDASKSDKFNYDDAQYIKATVNNENELIFDNIKFDSNNDYLFTFVQQKEDPSLDDNVLISKNIDTVKSNQFILYPNPVVSNENFTLNFNLKELSTVSIQVTDINGKTILSKDLKKIKNYQFSEKLSSTGTYLILVTIDGITETTKLIVK